MSKDNCIFATDRIHCSINEAESFKGIICKHHLNTIYGLEVCYQIFDDKSEQITVGPYLRVVKNWSFKPNTVLIPEKRFFDQTFKTHVDISMQIDTFQFEMNPKITQYVHDLITKDKKLKFTEIEDKRIHYEIIRNLSEKDPRSITDFDNILKSLQTKIQERFSSLMHHIDNSNNRSLFKHYTVEVQSQEDNKSNNSVNFEDNFSSFHKFLVSNMLFSYHLMPKTNGIVPSLIPNIMFVKGVGFVVLQEIIHPTNIVILGHEVGSPHLYASKAVTSYKPPKEISRPIKLPDNLHSYNLTNKLNLNKDC